MKVLFIRSGNAGTHPITTNQGLSLMNEGIEVAFFNIKGKGFSGYLSNIPALRKQIRQFKPDVLHAHYSLAAYLSTLSFTGVVTGVSLMGSDVKSTGKAGKWLIKLFAALSWKFVIVKSHDMYGELGLKSAIVLPNGVDLNVMAPIDKAIAQKTLGWDQSIKHILFASNPKRPEKNFTLALKAIELLKTGNIPFELHFLMNIPFDSMAAYYSAADVLLMTSRYEGSPNVIKEAMACNCPIVSTNVGDVRRVLAGTRNTAVCNSSAEEIKEALALILQNEERTDGRNKMQHYDSRIIALRLIGIYKEIMRK
jgi:glycosyltransferase involved in cell wall biosynthesis